MPVALARFAGRVDRLLREPTPTLRLREAAVCLLVFGLLHGAVIGTFTGIWAGQPLQIVYSAVKLPLLLLVAFGVALPSFFVVNTVAGVRGDWPTVLRNLMASQAALVVVLASLGPLVLLWYATTAAYPPAVIVNAGTFLAASVIAQLLLRRWYRPLVATNRRHLHLRRLWLVLYGFVGIQSGYVLRPFIGSPGADVTFFREEPWGNAYLVILNLLRETLGL